MDSLLNDFKKKTSLVETVYFPKRKEQLQANSKVYLHFKQIGLETVPVCLVTIDNLDDFRLYFRLIWLFSLYNNYTFNGVCPKFK